MRYFFCGCVGLFLWVACQPKVSTTVKGTGTPVLHINPFADTSDAHSAAILSTVEGYLTHRKDGSRLLEYWLAEDIERYRYPYTDLYYLPDEGWTATLLELLPIDTGQRYRVKLAFLNGQRELKAIYTVLVLRQADDTWRLARPLDYHTRHWKRHQVGNIHYIVSPQHTWDAAKAQAFDQFNDTLAAFFDMEPLTDLDYYLCTHPQELFQIRGYDYQPLMHKFETGGQNETWAHTIYSGNNSAWYPHELVHSYTYAKYGQQLHRIFDEGIATYLGGSGELPLAHHLNNVKRYLQEHPEATVLELLYENKEIYGRETACLYAIGGLFCKNALEKRGKEGLDRLLRSGREQADFLNALAEVLGIAREEAIDAYVRKALEQHTNH